MHSILLEYFRDSSRTEKIRSDLCTKQTSKSYQGSSKYSGNLISLLGHNYFRSLAYSKGFDEIRLDLDSVTALGGWCALRTKDINNIKNGLLEDAVSGEYRRYSSVAEVCEWVASTQTLDQITESVGVYRGSRYVIISERKLWSAKLENSLETYLNRSLSQKEIQLVYNSIVESEERKFEITQRYINYISGRQNDIKRIIDEDHAVEMELNTNRLLNEYKLYIQDLIEPILHRKKLKKADFKREEHALIEYFKEYSKAWYFFTGDYLENILKKYGYVKTKMAVLINPWQYSANYEMLVEQALNKELFNKHMAYLQPGTMNANLAFVAYISAEDHEFRQYKSNRSTSLIPNTRNLEEYRKRFLQETSRLDTTFLANNPFFVDIFNFAQSESNVSALSEIVGHTIKFSDERKNVQAKHSAKRSSLINQLREVTINEIAPKIKLLGEDYLEMLDILFGN